jgi:hypothetical protein
LVRHELAIPFWESISVWTVFGDCSMTYVTE